jgi:hypothetical protein
MKKWLLAWVVFTAYLIVNMTVMKTAEQPHLVATLVLGFFFYLIFGLRGLYGAMLAVSAIVLLAVFVGRTSHPNLTLLGTWALLLRLLLDLVTVMGGGGLAYWCARLVSNQTVK